MDRAFACFAGGRGSILVVGINIQMTFSLSGIKWLDLNYYMEPDMVKFSFSSVSSL